MKHVLHVITNAVDPALIATLQFQNERTDIRVSVVTTQNLSDTVVSGDMHICSLLDAEDRICDSSVPAGKEMIGYNRLMDLIFEAESIIAW